jgi:AcrR family transcriptional regulator
MTTVDHRRAVADRNRAAILAAAERLLATRQPLNMQALAAEAGLSRPTLYAHFKALPDVLEAVVDQVIADTLAAVEGAQLEEGPADAAVERMIDAGWEQLASAQEMARGVAEHLPTGHLHRAHAPLMALMFQLIERGQSDGTFRDDLPPAWLVRAYIALIHSADEAARSGAVSRADALAMVKRTVRDLLAAR